MLVMQSLADRKDAGMKSINRTLLIVTPKKPFFDWSNSMERSVPNSIPESEYRSAYLIPEKYNETNYTPFVKKHFLKMFEEELVSEYIHSEFWPKKRDYKTFNEWFEVQACDIVYDLSKEPLVSEEFE